VLVKQLIIIFLPLLRGINNLYNNELFKILIGIFKKIIPFKKIRTIIRIFYENVKVKYFKHKVIKLLSILKPLKIYNSPQYIVSLTSYGKRLTDTAPYAIITLLNQTVKPDRIILWVANEDKENIPRIMEKLKEKGLEIYYCEDLKSYKKLIPALEAFPNDYIITADDDIYYPKNWFESLIIEHRKNTKKIICHRAHGIILDENFNLLPYNKWDYCCEPDQSAKIFPTGCAGIFYPPKCFFKDITNKGIFMKLAPYADDIWFWAMAILNVENPYIVIKNGYSRYIQEFNPRIISSSSRLDNYNIYQGGNDYQLKAIIEYYPQILNIFKRIDKFKNE